MRDFIEIYENVFSKEFCDDAIKFFNKSEELGLTLKRPEPAAVEDKSYFLGAATSSSNELDLKRTPLMETFNRVFWELCYPKYKDKYTALHKHDDHGNFEVKLQKTKPYEGYHTWHSEQMCRATSTRLLVWTIYLNEEFEAGETEFLYQQRRIKPTMGSLCIFPASFTHTHRGNPPIGGDKYIITGWLEYL